LGKLILGYWGLVPFALGLMAKAKHQFYYYWLLAIGLYLVIFATGNVQHDYYQIFTIPIISIFVAKGMVWLLEAPKKMGFNLVACYLVLVAISAFTLAFSWFEVRGYYNINNPAIVEAGQAVDRLTEEDALVIAPYAGDTAFLYQTNRRGWPIGGNIDLRISQGADYYVTTEMETEAKELMERCGVFESREVYTIIGLSACNE